MSDGLTIDRYEDLVPAQQDGPGEKSTLELPLDDETAAKLATQLEEHMEVDGAHVEERLKGFDTRMAALEETASELEAELVAVQERIDALEAWRDSVAVASRRDP